MPVRTVWSRCAAPLVLGIVLALSAEAGAATPIATYEGETGISANRGTVAWSAYDPAAREFRLMLRERGTVRAAAVEPRRVPFDADVGRGPTGGALIVYSRCARESYNPDTVTTRMRDCDLYALDPEGDRERELRVRGARAADDRYPVVWGDRVVFERWRRGRTDLYVAPVRGGRARRISIRGGRDATVWDKDLLGERLAIAVIRASGGRDVTEVRLQQLDGSRARRVLRKAVGEAQRQFIGLGFDGGRLGFAMVCHPIGCDRGTAYRYFGGRLESARIPLSLVDFALARGRAFWVASPEDSFRWTVEDAGTLPFRRGAGRAP